MFLENELEYKDIQPIKEIYKRWNHYMRENIDFWLADSELHTKNHCSRVLLLALYLGSKKELGYEELEATYWGKTALYFDIKWYKENNYKWLS